MLARNSATSSDEVEGALTENFEWVVQTRELLNWLLTRLSQTVGAWQRFSSTRGDINYFDLDPSQADSQVWMWIRGVEESFDGLADLHQRLCLLGERCDREAQSVSNPLLYRRVTQGIPLTGGA